MAWQHLGHSGGNMLGLCRGLAGKNKSRTRVPGLVAGRLQPTADVWILRAVDSWHVAWAITRHRTIRDMQNDNRAVTRPGSRCEYSGVERCRGDIGV